MDFVKNFRFNDLVKVEFGEKWVFVPGKPEGDWQNTEKEGTGFRMNDLVLLDDIAGKINKAGSEAVIYHRFDSPADGVAQIGIGCDWYFECFVNGVFCFSTWQKGNGSVDFSPGNNPFLIPVKKGENRLAIRTKKDGGSWQFVCSPLEGVQTRICALQEDPWTGHLSSSGISVSFRTVGRIGAGIRFRCSGQDAWQTVWDAKNGRIVRQVFHKVFLKGLEPGASYEYQVVMILPENPEKQLFSQSYNVRIPRLMKRNSASFSPPIISSDREGWWEHSISFLMWLTGHKHNYLRSISFTGDLVAEGTPDAQSRDGRNYGFPVLTASGPNKKGKRTMCAFRVDMAKESIMVSVFDDKGVCMEKIIYDDRGNARVTEAVPEVKLNKFRGNE